MKTQDTTKILNVTYDGLEMQGTAAEIAAEIADVVLAEYYRDDCFISTLGDFERFAGLVSEWVESEDIESSQATYDAFFKTLYGALSPVYVEIEKDYERRKDEGEREYREQIWDWQRERGGL